LVTSCVGTAFKNIEGKLGGGIEVTGRRGRRVRQLLDDLKETRGCWKLKEKALGCTVWRTGFGAGRGLVRHGMNERALSVGSV
jgi:hypothetical protein